MTGSPAFHLFRFPIHIKPGFLMFMVLVIVVNGGELGFWIAGSAAVLTLLHELGHAFAARATGANAEISLDFLAGYASFVPVRPLKRWERAGISIAGPAVQIGVSLAILAGMGVNPLDRDSFGDTAASLAIWWTGPVMGLFNLIPVLPLDGGNIALAGLDVIIPGRSRTVMVWISIAITSVGGAYLLLTPRLQGFALFAMFPLLIQLQMLFAQKPRANPRRTMGSNGEAKAWRDDDISQIPEGLLPSPWYRAHQQLRQGQPETARAVLVADFGEPGDPNWWPPEAAPAPALESLVGLLPKPLPHGRAYSEYALAQVLLRLRRYEEAAHYASESFQHAPNTMIALVVAKAAGVLGDTDTSIGWLNAAYHADTHFDGLLDAMANAPELDSIRDDPRYLRLNQLLDS